MSTHTGYDAQTGHMDFSLALREMKKGKKVRRAEWPKRCSIELRNGLFVDERTCICDLSTQQILATDWEEVL